MEIDRPRRTNGGLEIKKISKERGLPQRMLAKLAGINRSSLRRIEGGLTEGKIGLIECLADALGYDLDLFHRGLHGSGYQMNPSEPLEGTPDCDRPDATVYWTDQDGVDRWTQLSSLIVKVQKSG
jgi:transcriptional regulator with XRE-family HTH domain